MPKNLKVLGVICLLLVFVTGIVVAESSLEERLEEVEELSSEIWQLDGDEQADEKEELLLTRIDLVEEIMADYPNEAEVYWELSEAYHDLAFHRENIIDYLEQAKEYAEQSIELAPDEAVGYFWRGALTGQIGLEEGIRASLSGVEPMKEDLEQAIEIDPDFAAAYDALAQLYINVPGWPISIGDDDKALEYRQESVRLEPNNFSYQWKLYENYKEVGDDTQAQEVLENILELPDDEEQSNAEEIREKARQELN